MFRDANGYASVTAGRIWPCGTVNRAPCGGESAQREAAARHAVGRRMNMKNLFAFVAVVVTAVSLIGAAQAFAQSSATKHSRHVAHARSSKKGSGAYALVPPSSIGPEDRFGRGIAAVRVFRLSAQVRCSRSSIPSVNGAYLCSLHISPFRTTLRGPKLQAK
jgi:hypothetical protein